MFTALTLTLALGAPVPVPSTPAPAGMAPRVMELKADASGKVMITITRMEKVQVGVGAAIAPAGGALPPPAAAMMPVAKAVELGEVKDLVFTTADGMKVEKEDAMKKLAGGAIVVVTSDGKPVSPAFLKVFKDDTLVLVSPELIVPVGGVMGGGGGFRVNPGGNIRPLPAPIGPGGVIQIQPGVIQVIPIGPGGVQVEVAPVPVNKVPEKAPVK